VWATASDGEVKSEVGFIMLKKFERNYNAHFKRSSLMLLYIITYISLNQRK
jgi:hypothetical protein